jgi:hypothetical protein
MTTEAEPKTIYDLYVGWTDEEKKQALIAMPIFRVRELGVALINSGWTPTDLINSGWTPTDLINSGWTPTDLINSGWTPTALINSGWTPTALINSGWTPTALSEENHEADIKKKSIAMGKRESQFVIDTLRAGLMNGSDYGSVKSCGCFLGTAAKLAELTVKDFCKLHDIKKDSSSPAEQ